MREKKNRIIWKKVVKMCFIALIVFSPGIYFLFSQYLPCKTNLQNKQTNTIVVGESFGKISYNGNGMNIDFKYSYKGNEYNTGKRGSFSKIPNHTLLTLIEIDTIRPTCFRILFDSIYINDTISLKYVRNSNTRDILLIKNNNQLENYNLK